jgi:hypothetical protein
MPLLATGLLFSLVAPASASAERPAPQARVVATVHVAVRPLAVQQAPRVATKWAKKSSVKTRYGASGSSKYRRTVRVGYKFTVDVSSSTKNWWKVKSRQEWVAKKDVTASEKSLWSRKDFARLQAWRMINATKGWNVHTQYPCYKRLINRESGWRRHARNSGSGAYGIPQALPGNKMAVAGRDWRDNPTTQLKWGLRYVKGRYDTPCRAWGFFARNGWY